VRDAAAELLNIYARRAARRAMPSASAPDYEQFARLRLRGNGRPAAAIHAVMQDMISPQPMDRLVCGDVGFGKTEVALRAAFVAPWAASRWPSGAHHAAGRAALPDLVDRFAKWPVKVAEMSRFRSAKEIKAALKGIADGTVDIVVGTHKLLSEKTSSRTWACSSSTRSTASACATRRP
jgi:transcription-repair coupling factor (superfamily II helicase)